MATAAQPICSALRAAASGQHATPTVPGSVTRLVSSPSAAPQQLLQRPAVWLAGGAGACGCACAPHLGLAYGQDQGEGVRYAHTPTTFKAHVVAYDRQWQEWLECTAEAGTVTALAIEAT